MSSILFFTWLSGCAGGVLLMPHVLLRKKEPVAKTAWLLTLLFLSWLGVLLYAVFGYSLSIRRAQRRLRAEKTLFSYCRELVEQPEDVWLARLATASTNFPPRAGNHVRFLVDHTDTYPAFAEAIAGAKQFVHAEFYTVQPDRTGFAFIDQLTAAAQRGIEVRLLVDSVGSLTLKRKHLRFLREAGGKFAVFLPVNPLKKRLQVNYRNHRKILVVDGDLGFTGGLNIGEEYRGGPLAPGGHWRDTQLKIHGPAVRDLARVFLSDWAFASGEILPERQYAARSAQIGDDIVHIAASGPDFEENAVAQVCFGAIMSGREEILVQTPYLVPDHSMLMALRTAALSGAHVKVMVPSVSDTLVTRWATRSYYDVLLSAGVEIHEYQPGMVHAKMIVVDRRVCTIGTANLDERSFRLNFEVIAILYNDDTCARAAALFEEDLRHCQCVDPDAHARRSRWTRVGESVVQLLSPIL